jgi:hypothetical protein
VAARPPKRPRVTAEQRAELLRVLRIGMEFRTSCARAKVSVAAVQADAKLYAEALEAFRLGNARLREQAVELTFDAKSTSAGSRAALLDRILNRRDAELARLEAAVPRSEASATKSTDDTIELIAQVFERLLQNDPLKVLPRYIEVAFSTGKLSAEAKAAARRLVEVLEGHAPLPYSPEWWAAEKAAGRNGYRVVDPRAPGYVAPRAAREVEPPERVWNPPPLRPEPGPVTEVREVELPAAPATMERWYGANWQDGPWRGR